MPTKKRNQMRSAGAWRPKTGSGWVSLFVLACMIVLAGASVASAYSGSAQAAQHYVITQANTPTANPDTGGAAGGAAGNAANQASPPPPESTEAAAASATAQASGPNSVATGGPPPLPTGEAAGATGTGGATSATPGGEFPWLIVIGVVIVALAGLVFAAMRTRRPVQTTAPAAAPQARRRADMRDLAAPPPGSTRATTTTTTATAAGGVAAAAGTVTCPNCGTSNASTEKYCRECGQDLRPVIEQMAAAQPAGAAAAPVVDVVEADTPYLETIDRVDEQLEFVLSRPRVVIGTASGNDIVIDAGFNGWQTVSPQHAELRREADGFVVVDRDSENGTFVNEMRTGENILSDGDLVRLGDVKFYFRVPKSEG